MKWTREMVDRAKKALLAKYPYNMIGSDDVALILDAALAPLPEPNEDYKGVWLAAIERIRRAEAKLEKVRAQAVTWKGHADETEQRNKSAFVDGYRECAEKLEAILGGAA